MKHNDRINNKSKAAFAVMGVSGVNLEVDVYTHTKRKMQVEAQTDLLSSCMGHGKRQGVVVKLI